MVWQHVLANAAVDAHERIQALRPMVNACNLGAIGERNGAQDDTYAFEMGASQVRCELDERAREQR